MKTFATTAAQGDILLRRVDELPKGLAERKPDHDGCFVVAHSETGHHHTLSARGVAVLEETGGNPLLCYLRIDADYADLVHHRPHDTHETVRVPRGLYELRRQREYTPQGWRRVED